MEDVPSMCPTPFSSPVTRRSPLLRPTVTPRRVLVVPHMSDLRLPPSGTANQANQTIKTSPTKQQTVLHVLQTLTATNDLGILEPKWHCFFKKKKTSVVLFLFQQTPVKYNKKKMKALLTFFLGHLNLHQIPFNFFIRRCWALELNESQKRKSKKGILKLEIELYVSQVRPLTN